MTRFLLAFLILLSSPTMAKDDGGFGSARFTAQAPAALGGPAPVNQMAVNKEVILKQSPSDIEPAAGEEDNKKSSDIEQSNHKVAPYIIQKDLEVR